jgi:predicted metal-binding protein
MIAKWKAEEAEEVDDEDRSEVVHLQSCMLVTKPES